MKSNKMIFILMAFCLLPFYVQAADFDWTKDFNIRAEADPGDFRARLATRFKIGGEEMDAVVGNVPHPSDAYMIFRLSEMSKRPTHEVMDEYRSSQGKGWGVLAKSLGIKPGSREFHALKKDSDLYKAKSHQKGTGKNKHKDHEKKNDKK